jgi:hypothetical protein
MRSERSGTDRPARVTRERERPASSDEPPSMTEFRRLVDRAGSSPPQAFFASQTTTLACGGTGPDSVERRIVKSGSETLFCDRTPRADTRRASEPDGACRKEEIGSHIPTRCIRWPRGASDRVATVERLQSGLRKDLDAVVSRTERDGVLHGVREVGSPAAHWNRHRSSPRLVRPPGQVGEPARSFPTSGG